MRNNFVPALSPAQVAYQKYLRSPRWWILRRLRLWVDGNRCRMCGTMERLEVHHRSYRWRGAWRFWREVDDTTTVCRDCHNDFHDQD